SFSEEEKRYFRARIAKLKETWATQRENEVQSMKLQLDQIKDRKNRLTDAYLDQALDKEAFEERKRSLIVEQQMIEESLSQLSHGGRGPDRIEKFLELAANAPLSHRTALPEEKRDMVNFLTSNR